VQPRRRLVIEGPASSGKSTGCCAIALCLVDPVLTEPARTAFISVGCLFKDAHSARSNNSTRTTAPGEVFAPQRAARVKSQ